MEGEMQKEKRTCKEEGGGQESEQSNVKTNVDSTNQRTKGRKSKRKKEICEFPLPPRRPPLMPSIHHPASNISYSVAPLLTAELISALITLIGGMLMKERDEAFWDSGLIPLL